MLGADGLLLFLILISSKEQDADRKTCTEEERSVTASWQVEPLGYMHVTEPLTQLIWKQPLLLFGVGADAALLLLVGLQRLWIRQKQGGGDSEAPAAGANPTELSSKGEGNRFAPRKSGPLEADVSERETSGESTQEEADSEESGYCSDNDSPEAPEQIQVKSPFLAPVTNLSIYWPVLW